MANEISVTLNSHALSSTNNIAIEDINIQVAKAVRSFELPKNYGSVVPISKRNSMILRVKGTIIDSDYDALRTGLDSLKSKLESSSEYQLTIDDDRYLNVQYRNFAYAWKKLRTFATFNFDLIASDPFWYASTATTANPQSWTTGVTFTVTNSGNAPTRLKVTITGGATPVSDDITVENTTTSERFQYRGSLVENDVLIINNRVDASDVAVTKNGTSDIVNFEGDFITLNPGANSIKLTSAISNLVLRLDHRNAWY